MRRKKRRFVHVSLFKIYPNKIFGFSEKVVFCKLQLFRAVQTCPGSGLTGINPGVLKKNSLFGQYRDNSGELLYLKVLLWCDSSFFFKEFLQVLLLFFYIYCLRYRTHFQYLLLLLWWILNGRGLPNCLAELPSLKCLSSSFHSRDSHPFANVLRPSPSGSPSASPTLTCALQE